MVTCVWRFSLCRPFCPFSFLVCNQVFFPASTPTRRSRHLCYILSRLSRHYPVFTPRPGFHAAIPVSTPPRAFTLDHNRVEDSLPRLRIVFVYFSTCGLFRRTNHYPPTGPAPGHTTTQPFHTRHSRAANRQLETPLSESFRSSRENKYNRPGCPLPMVPGEASSVVGRTQTQK